MFSLEMSASSLVDRVAALDLGIHLRKFREPRLLMPAERANLIEARDRLETLPLVIDETAGLSLATLKARARLMKRRHGVGLIVVDYLQLVRGEGDSHRERVGDVARGLKNLAKELGVGVVAASQLARPPKGVVSAPTMLDLKESGEIEAAADVVLLIHRPGVLTQRPEDAEEDRIILGKNRHGPVGAVPVVFDGAHARFLPRDTRRAA
jgi:replicative DNA helicase